MNRLGQLLDALGPAGVVGIGVLMFCALFYFSALEPLQRELGAQQAAADRLKARAPVQIASTRDRADELQRFYGLFPPVSRLPDELERVYGLARDAKLEIRQGEYRLESRGSGLLSYRVTLPIRGTYPQVRQFIGAALKDISIASVDMLRFERKKVGEAQLEGQVRLTIHFRPDGDAAVRTAGETEETR